MKHNYKNPDKTSSLRGDASTRIFKRLEFKDGFTAVSMLTPIEQKIDFEKFLRMQELYTSHSIPVPEVYEADPDSLEIFMEDLGDLDLNRALRTASEKERVDYYRELLRLMALIAPLENEYKSISSVPHEILAEERLSWELEFFLKNYCEYFNHRFSPLEADALKEWFHELTREISAMPVALCHRDYHSRNVMVRDGSLYLVDFQDTRMGPFNYDLVSLLWDSYHKLPADEIQSLECHYYQLLKKDGLNLEFDRYKDFNRLTALQRNIKALGTFAAQGIKGNQSYIEYIAPTWDSISEHIKIITIPQNIENSLIKLKKIPGL